MKDEEPVALHPLAKGPLGAFLRDAASVLVGRIGGLGADTGLRVSCANAALARLTGCAGEAELAVRLSGASLVRCRRAVADVLAGSPFRRTRLVFLADGRNVAYHALMTPGGEGSVWLLAEPTAVRPRHSACLRDALKEARTDPLTGLANRRQADAWLGSAVQRAERRGEPLSCLVVDLDRFKAVNDTLGHPAGDRVLAAVARALADTLRAGDRLARLGGDEFLVLLPRAGLAGAAAAAGRLLEAVAGQTVGLPGEPSAVVRVTASAGAAERRPGEAAEALLARADAALRRAKQGGRDRVESDANPGLNA